MSTYCALSSGAQSLGFIIDFETFLGCGINLNIHTGSSFLFSHLNWLQEGPRVATIRDADDFIIIRVLMRWRPPGLPTHLLLRFTPFEA